MRGCQYYYKRNSCQASHSHDPDCICWHNEGSGPLSSVKQGQDCETTGVKLTWRLAPLKDHEIRERIAQDLMPALKSKI